MKQYEEKMAELQKLTARPFDDRAETDNMNIDNWPTHKMKCEETGEIKEYCGASKHWEWVSPKITDRHSLHFAPEDRVYIILKNKYTKKWEFPSGKFFLDESFTRGMQNVF